MILKPSSVTWHVQTDKVEELEHMVTLVIARQIEGDEQPARVLIDLSYPDITVNDLAAVYAAANQAMDAADYINGGGHLCAVGFPPPDLPAL